MKKVLALLLIAIIGLFAFVACNPDSSLNEELVNVTITSRDTRSLSVESSFNLGDVTVWKYTAKKADNGLKTGETTTEVELKDRKTQQLSQGSWDFKLFGYNVNGNLICVGKALNTTITVENHTISILVGPQQTETGRGKIFIDSNISIADKDGKLFKDTENVYTKVVTVKDSSENKVEESRFNFVKSGMYSVTVEYKAKDKDNNEYVAASAKKYFNVYDNLTTTISGTVEEITQSGKANPEAEKVVASVDGVYYESIKDALLASSKDKPLVLLKDATLNETVTLTKNASIDLKGYTLTAKHLILDESTNNAYEVKIENGTIEGDVIEGNLFNINNNATLILDNVTIDYTSPGSGAGICFYEGAQNATLEVNNSTIKIIGGFGIGTNAKKGNDTVSIKVENSTVITDTKNEDNTAILFNVPTDLTISNSTISGERQGVIVRGGTATISNSTIISSGTTTNYYDSGDYVNSNWGSGNEVPLAALVVGNRSGSYQYKTNVELKDVELSTPYENTVRKSIYVYQNDTTNTVTVTGNIKGECTINEENTRNGALVFPEAKIGDTYYQTFEEAVKAVKENESIVLSKGIKTKLPSVSEKGVSIIGDGSQIIDMENVSVNCGDGLTFSKVKFIDTAHNYGGIISRNSVEYNDCNFIGTKILYGNKETFNGCTFLNEYDNYCVRLYTAKEVKFVNCHFSADYKALLMYNEQENFNQILTVRQCTFEGGQNDTGKAAISVNKLANGKKWNKARLEISDSNFSNWVGIESKSKSNIWGNPEDLDSSELEITIDGSRVYLKRIVTRSELQDALTKLTEAGSGNNTIEIAEDLSLKEGETWTPANIDGYHGAGVITINGNGHTISGLNAPLLAGGFAGNSGVVINDLTLDNVNISDSTNDQGLGAFIGCIDSMPKIELNNCHLTNSKITSTGGARVGGLIGWTSGYNNPNDGPVDTYITIENCSVENCEITANGSVGGIIGHAGANPATYHTIENCSVKNTELISTDDGGWKVGVVVGTANVGEVTIKNITESGNTLTQTDKTAPEGQSKLFGRFVPGTKGKLTIDGISIQ